LEINNLGTRPNEKVIDYRDKSIANRQKKSRDKSILDKRKVENKAIDYQSIIPTIPGYDASMGVGRGPGSWPPWIFIHLFLSSCHEKVTVALYFGESELA